MNCPVCQVNLVITDRQGIEIDYCPKCRGVWLDRGELDKLIERSAQPYQAAPPPQQVYTSPQPQPVYHHKAEHGYYQKPYKKKSILGEIFDF
ncbi:MAG: zf-TFIIB domain-containing protein [Bacteroidetes bacterium]|nr:zf-TFIIB domain-containing protein [Bacteroidota bacterium]